jgi:hypothetical protein
MFALPLLMLLLPVLFWRGMDAAVGTGLELV